MTWLMLFALLIVVLVAGAVLPRHRTTPPALEGRRQFPWFWIAFPVTMLALGMAISLLLRLPGPITYGWTMYMPLSEDIHQPVLSVSGLIWLVVAVVGAVLSVLAWRRGRI